MTAVDAAFAAHRRELWGLLYRMTGSAADADDLLQDTFARALERPPPRLDLPIKPWLAKVALNLARDHLRARKKRAYVGPWLPSPIESEEEPPAFEPGAEWRYDMLESVSFAFLLALEVLTPSQRAVLLLRDVFDYSVKETAAALDLTEANTKQIHLRARKRMKSYHDERRLPSPEVHAQTLAAMSALVQRVAAQDVQGVAELLAQDVRALSDGAGEYYAALKPLRGPLNVAKFLVGVSKKRGTIKGVELKTLNGAPSFVLRYDGRQNPREADLVVFTVDVDPLGLVTRVYSVLAKEKLTRLS